MAATSSSRVIQLWYCRPDARRPPRPKRNSGSCLRRAPPRRDCTTPVRIIGPPRIPACSAGAVACSHCWTTSGRYPDPGGAVLVEDLVAAGAVEADRLSPAHQHIGSRVHGGQTAGQQVGRNRPAPSGSAPLRSAGVQRLSAIAAPARCTAASTPMRARFVEHDPRSGSQDDVPLPRLRRTTSWPSASKAAPRAEPIIPWLPVMSTFTLRLLEAPERHEPRQCPPDPLPLRLSISESRNCRQEAVPKWRDPLPGQGGFLAGGCPAGVDA